MTLNLTVVTPTRIYQSADYRLYDIGTRVCADFRTQKLLLVNAGNWSATIAFAGIGRVGSIDVREWLVDRVRAVQMDDPIEVDDKGIPGVPIAMAGEGDLSSLLAHLPPGAVRRSVTMVRVGASDEYHEAQLARERFGDAADIERVRALALDLRKGPVEERLNAYWSAIGLNPRDAGLRLGLAQLLFVRGKSDDAHEQIARAPQRNARTH